MTGKRGSEHGISRNVYLTGFTSFFTDISSEMIYPLIQAFVSAIMVSAKGMIGPILGVIEGIAEATASLLKVYSGHISDKFQSRKPLTITGYLLSALSKLIYLLAGFGWLFILFARFSDRVGKGIRTAPRDALIAESVDSASQGRAYGFQRAMDYFGALLGVVLCYLFSLNFLSPDGKTITDLDSFYILFIISVIPASIGVVLLFFIKEKKKDQGETGKTPVRLSFRGLDSRLKVFLIAVFLFTLGNSSNQFLLLKSMDLGVTLPDVLLMYMLFNFTTSVLSAPLGALSDKIGRKRIILAGYFLYAFIYIMFGFVTPADSSFLWLFWVMYGIYYALTEGIEKALVSDLAPADRKATVMGLFSTIVGIGLLPASLIAGALYSFAGTSSPFLFGGIMAGSSFLVILVFLRVK